MPAAAQLPLTQAQVLSQLELLRHAGQRLAVHQLGAQPGQLALGRLREALPQRLGDQEAEDGVAEELQALVVARLGTAMGERIVEQLRVGEGVAQPPHQALRVLPHCIMVVGLISVWLLKDTTMSTLPSTGSRTS